jgi:hypothetical protein
MMDPIVGKRRLVPPWSSHSTICGASDYHRLAHWVLSHTATSVFFPEKTKEVVLTGLWLVLSKG